MVTTFSNPFRIIDEETQEKWANIVNSVNKVVEWFKHIKENITDLSISLLTWSYDVIANVVLHTPTILFNSEWFSKNILMFTGLSIVVSIVLAIVEGYKRMFGRVLKKAPNYTDMATISKRLPLVILGSGLAPLAFYHGTKIINWLTGAIIDITRLQMNKGIASMDYSDITVLGVIAFIGFDIALIGMMVPVFLQNFRRWFDLLALGVMTPLALSCWMFDSHKHYFKSWWEHIKKCSTVQLVYAVFLLIIGSLMFGSQPPTDEMDLFIKMGIVIGGLWRMSNPPNIMRRYLDTGTDVRGMWKGVGDAVMPHPLLRKGFKKIKGSFKKGDA